MKTLLLVTVLMLAGAQGLPPVQEPAQYPDGWQCTPHGTNKNGQQTGEDPCACVTTIHDDLCEGAPEEANTCKQWCHWKKGKCGCPVHCAPSRPSPGAES